MLDELGAIAMRTDARRPEGLVPLPVQQVRRFGQPDATCACSGPAGDPGAEQHPPAALRPVEEHVRIAPVAAVIPPSSGGEHGVVRVLGPAVEIRARRQADGLGWSRRVEQVERMVLFNHHAGGDHPGVRFARRAGANGDRARLPVDQITADKMGHMGWLQCEQMTLAVVEEGKRITQSATGRRQERRSGERNRCHRDYLTRSSRRVVAVRRRLDRFGCTGSRYPSSPEDLSGDTDTGGGGNRTRVLKGARTVSTGLAGCYLLDAAFANRQTDDAAARCLGFPPHPQADAAVSSELRRGYSSLRTALQDPVATLLSSQC